MDHEEAIKIRATERYLLGELSPEERDDFEAHFFECPVCGGEIRSADLFLASLRTVLAEEAVEPKPTKGSWLRESLAGWFGWTWAGGWKPSPAFATVAVLAVILSGQSILLWRTHARLSEAEAPRLLASAVLRPETRGEPVRFHVQNNQPLLLTFDVESPQGYLRYRIEISSASGARVAELSAPAPPAEKPVMLSIPGGKLKEGRHELTVYGSSASGETGPLLGKYHFEVIRKEGPAQ